MDFDSLIDSEFKNRIVTIDQLLAFCTEHGCSDLYIKAGSQPYIGRHGLIHEVTSMPINDPAWGSFANVAISSESNSKYVREKMLDFSYAIDIPEGSKFSGKYRSFRYRVSAGFSMKRYCATFRMITPDPPTFNKLNFSPVVKEAIKTSFKTKTGIVLLCGPTGSGKTTTLACSINDFTEKGEPLSNSMIVTLEDPIEYEYKSKRNVRIIQKELGIDFKSYGSGVMQSLREKPTHILCGEIRDREGINICVEASRTGHKVISTFHTDDVAGSISRMFFYVSSGENSQEAMFDIISNLSFILCQRMVTDEKSFRIETQYMLFTDEIKRTLQRVVVEGLNIPMSINRLFENEGLKSAGLVKDWS